MTPGKRARRAPPLPLAPLAALPAEIHRRIATHLGVRDARSYRASCGGVRTALAADDGALDAWAPRAARVEVAAPDDFAPEVAAACGVCSSNGIDARVRDLERLGRLLATCPPFVRVEELALVAPEEALVEYVESTSAVRWRALGPVPGGGRIRALSVCVQRSVACALPYASPARHLVAVWLPQAPSLRSFSVKQHAIDFPVVLAPFLYTREARPEETGPALEAAAAHPSLERLGFSFRAPRDDAEAGVLERKLVARADRPRLAIDSAHGVALPRHLRYLERLPLEFRTINLTASVSSSAWNETPPAALLARLFVGAGQAVELVIAEAPGHLGSFAAVPARAVVGPLRRDRRARPPPPRPDHRHLRGLRPHPHRDGAGVRRRGIVRRAHRPVRLLPPAPIVPDPPDHPRPARPRRRGAPRRCRGPRALKVHLLSPRMRSVFRPQP